MNNSSKIGDSKIRCDKCKTYSIELRPIHPFYGYYCIYLIVMSILTLLTLDWIWMLGIFAYSLPLLVVIGMFKYPVIYGCTYCGNEWSYSDFLPIRLLGVFIFIGWLMGSAGYIPKLYIFLTSSNTESKSLRITTPDANLRTGSGASGGLAAKYSVLKTDDVGNASMRRYRVTVIMEPNSDAVSVRSAIEDVVNKLSSIRKVNAIAIFVYDRPQDARGVYTLAQAEWAPNGKWSDADKVAAGDYSRHRYLFSLRGKVLNPSTTSRPTEREFALYDEMERLVAKYPDFDEEILRRQAAEVKGASVDEVRSADEHVAIWKLE
ncbi:MAG: hypothetical protein NTZ05_19260 [Chloroflexi bacterium]|nr:hypothetical protein [Chloroflexota bacterium]